MEIKFEKVINQFRKCDRSKYFSNIFNMYDMRQGVKWFIFIFKNSFE
jgi:hypothetical protein